MDESLPETQPFGALTPPPSGPGTAIAASAPLPPRPHRLSTSRRTGLHAFVERALDRLDIFADNIAEIVGLR
ncbi:MAG: hypothetical protein ABI625_02855 [bacterium]